MTCNISKFELLDTTNEQRWIAFKPRALPSNPEDATHGFLRLSYDQEAEHASDEANITLGFSKLSASNRTYRHTKNPQISIDVLPLEGYSFSYSEHTLTLISGNPTRGLDAKKSALFPSFRELVSCMQEEMEERNFVIFRIHIVEQEIEFIEYFRDFVSEFWPNREIHNALAGALCDLAGIGKSLEEVKKEVGKEIHDISMSRERCCPGCGVKFDNTHGLFKHFDSSDYCKAQCHSCQVEVFTIQELISKHRDCFLACGNCLEKGDWLDLQDHLIFDKCADVLRRSSQHSVCVSTARKCLASVSISKGDDAPDLRSGKEHHSHAKRVSDGSISPTGVATRGGGVLRGTPGARKISCSMPEKEMPPGHRRGTSTVRGFAARRSRPIGPKR
jgi:hypothetical protein